MTDNSQYFDGREMLMFHDMFRREFALMPDLVRAVASGDGERMRIVADHIAGVNAVLHAHHHGEDVHVWPLLLEHGRLDAEQFVPLMETQHAGIERAASEADEALAAWRVSAAADARDALVDALARLNPTLKEHMAAEEAHVVPLMQKYITAAEWNRMAGEGAAEIDPQTLILGFGMVMYEGDPEIIDFTVKNMPVDIQPVIRQLASDAFAGHSERVHGTMTPPRSTQL